MHDVLAPHKKRLLHLIDPKISWTEYEKTRLLVLSQELNPHVIPGPLVRGARQGPYLLLANVLDGVPISTKPQKIKEVGK